MLEPPLTMMFATHASLDWKTTLLNSSIFNPCFSRTFIAGSKAPTLSRYLIWILRKPPSGYALFAKFYYSTAPDLAKFSIMLMTSLFIASEDYCVTAAQE